MLLKALPLFYLGMCITVVVFCQDQEPRHIQPGTLTLQAAPGIGFSTGRMASGVVQRSAFIGGEALIGVAILRNTTLSMGGYWLTFRTNATPIAPPDQKGVFLEVQKYFPLWPTRLPDTLGGKNYWLRNRTTLLTGATLWRENNAETSNGVVVSSPDFRYPGYAVFGGARILLHKRFFLLYKLSLVYRPMDVAKIYPQGTFSFVWQIPVNSKDLALKRLYWESLRRKQ